MSVSRQKLLVAGGIAAVVLVVGVVAAATDNLRLAVVCILLIQAAGLLAVVDTRRLQGRSTAAVAKNTVAVARVDRELAGVTSRAASEAKAARRDLKARLARTQRALDRRADFRLQDVEAMFQLFGKFPLRAAMPPSGRWALEPSGLLRIIDLVERRPIQTIVELGSGTSTLWLSYALEKRGTGGRIVSLDHETHYAQLTRESLAVHGFKDGPADVRDAPLVDTGLDGHATPWYDAASFQDVEAIDLLIIDGPPKATGDLARYPAVPMLLSRLSPNAIIVVDDAARPDETEMVERWMADIPRLRVVDESGPGRQILLALGT